MEFTDMSMKAYATCLQKAIIHMMPQYGINEFIKHITENGYVIGIKRQY